MMAKDLVRDGNRIRQVVTDHGNIEAGRVVNAAGLWARQVGWMAGVEISAGVVEHQYLVAEKTGDIPTNLPAFRDPDGGYYVKPEPGALAIGGWEKITRKVNPKEGFPWAYERHLFDADMDRLEEFLEPAKPAHQHSYFTVSVIAFTSGPTISGICSSVIMNGGASRMWSPCFPSRVRAIGQQTNPFSKAAFLRRAESAPMVLS